MYSASSLHAWKRERKPRFHFPNLQKCEKLLEIKMMATLSKTDWEINNNLSDLYHLEIIDVMIPKGVHDILISYNLSFVYCIF